MKPMYPKAGENPPFAQPATLTFYTRVFGWDFDLALECGSAKYWPIATDIFDEQVEVDSALGSNSPIAVVSLEHSLERVLREGGRIVSPCLVVPGSGYLAYCEDTAGNPFGVFESDPSAK